MTDRQKLEIRSSEIRVRLNAIAAMEGDALTTEVRSEAERLTAELDGVETWRWAAIAAEPDHPEVRTTTDDPDTRERLEIRSPTGVADFVNAAI